METDLLADQFINYLRIERGLADNTIQSYSRDLNRFFQFLEARALSPLITSQDQIMEYVGLIGRGLSARSVARNISTIKTFFRFLAAEGKTKSSPARLLETPRLARRLPKILNQGEVERLISQPDSSNALGPGDSVEQPANQTSQPTTTEDSVTPHVLRIRRCLDS